LFEHPIKNLAGVATSEVLVLDTQTTRAEMAEHVLAVAPQRFPSRDTRWAAGSRRRSRHAPERVSKLFLCDTWARKPDGTDEYLPPTTNHHHSEAADSMASGVMVGWTPGPPNG
jgi:hypothetical protein